MKKAYTYYDQSVSFGLEKCTRRRRNHKMQYLYWIVVGKIMKERGNQMLRWQTKESEKWLSYEKNIKAHEIESMGGCYLLAFTTPHDGPQPKNFT